MDCPKGNAMAGLPDEAMLEILARTPFRSVCRSKCVAKAWRDLINDPLNRGRLLQTLQGFFSIFYWKGNLEHRFIEYSTSSMPLDIDPCFSFLVTKLPENESLGFLDSCNGLFLFMHYPKSNPNDVLGYIVCNPATKHWAAVPVCACCFPSGFQRAKFLFGSNTSLSFKPVVSSHFHLIQFWRVPLSVHTYSSETGVWSHSQTDRNEQGQLEGWRRQGGSYKSDQRICVNGILHLMVYDEDRCQIVAVDVQGRTKRTIKIPDAAQGSPRSYIGQSQGRLHCINQGHGASCDYEVSIWVLQDYDTQEWVLKDTVSASRLHGTINMCDFVGIHPDCNVVFFFDPLNRLIAYDMDRKNVSVDSILSGRLRKIVPYIPYFSESPALTNKN